MLRSRCTAPPGCAGVGATEALAQSKLYTTDRLQLGDAAARVPHGRGRWHELRWPTATSLGGADRGGDKMMRRPRVADVCARLLRVTAAHAARCRA
eukprot:scaffold1394_cov382-Prasinococcus_capsulatus_cf.AAC.2